MLVLDVWCNSPDADTHGTNEHKGIEVLPAFADIHATDDFAFMLLGIHLTQYQAGDALALLANLYNRYLLHFSIVMG